MEWCLRGFVNKQFQATFWRAAWVSQRTFTAVTVSLITDNMSLTKVMLRLDPLIAEAAVTVVLILLFVIYLIDCNIHWGYVCVERVNCFLSRQEDLNILWFYFF